MFPAKEKTPGFLKKAFRDPQGSVGELIDDYFWELFPKKVSLGIYIGHSFLQCFSNCVFGHTSHKVSSRNFAVSWGISPKIFLPLGGISWRDCLKYFFLSDIRYHPGGFQREIS